MRDKSKILLTRELQDFAMRDLRRRYQVSVHSGRFPMPKKKLKSMIGDVEGLVCFPYDKIDAEIIDAAENLRVISTYSVGYDHIDVNAAKKRRIKIGYTPEVLTDATADLTIALMLDLLRRLTEGDRLIRSGKWNVIFGADDYVGTDLKGKKLGILGMGRIGTEVARRASSFGMKIIYHTRTRLPKRTESGLSARHVSFERLVSDCDILSVHVPHTKETDWLIDMEVFRMMKKEAFLINTARGRIIKEGDLVTALRKRIIAGAALDVFESEPISGKHPLAKMQNVVLAPHIGSSTVETRRKMAEITVNNLVLGLEGRKMIYSVSQSG